MAGDLITQGMGNFIPSISISGNMMRTIMWLALLGALAFFVARAIRFRHKAIVWDLTGGVPLMSEDKVCIRKDRAGNQVWQFLKAKITRQAPERSSVGVLSTLVGGTRMFAQIVKRPDGSYHWLSLDAHEIEGKIEEMEARLKPQSAEERLAFKEEIQIAQSYDTKGWLKQNLPAMVGMGAIVVIFFGFLIFYEDLWRPLNTVQGLLVEQQQELQDSQMRWMRFMEGKQSLDEQEAGIQAEIPAEPPR